MSAPRCRTLAAVVVLAVTLGLVGAACGGLVGASESVLVVVVGAT